MKKSVKKGVIALAMVTLMNSINFPIVNASEIVTCEDVIQKMVSLENIQSWEEFTYCWIEDEREEFNSLFSDSRYLQENEGVICVTSAEIYSLNEIPEEYIPGIILEDEQYNKFAEKKYFLVGIDYEVSNVSKYFYNGVNYRLVIMAKENGEWKVAGRQDATGLLDDWENNSYFTDIISNENVNVAMEIRNARISGYVIDSDMCEEDSSGVVTYGYRPGYSATTKCSHTRPSTVKVRTGSSGDSYTSPNLQDYIKDVMPNEWVISTTGAAALQAGIVTIQQYAVWNCIYYQKYPDYSYDLRASSGDQNYVAGSYSNLATRYQTKIDDAYDAVGSIHMETGSNSSLFQSQYASTKSDYAYGRLFQDEAKTMASNGYTYKQILNYFYDNTAQLGISDIGTVKFASYN